MMRRPASVPRAAKYSVRDGWWQVGEVRDGEPFGPWRTWRPDGSALFEARFDSKGRLQGRMRRFHPDGSLAREARYEHGALSGQLVYHRAKGVAGDLFPSGDPRVWQVIVKFDEGKEVLRTLLDENGGELAKPSEAKAAPSDETAGALDTLFANAQPDGFLASGALTRVAAIVGEAPAAMPDDFLLPFVGPVRRALDPRRFQDLYGHAPTPAIRSWLEIPGTPKFLGAVPARDNALATDGNLIEALILEHQAAPGRTAGLRALTSGIVPIAVADAKMQYGIAIGEAEHSSTDAVYPLLLAADDLAPPVARTLDDFAYAVALTSAAHAGAVSLTCLQTAYERLRGRVDLRGPMASVEERALTDEEDEVVGETDKDHREGFHFRRPSQLPRHFFFRCRWLVRLLCGFVEGAAKDFDPKFEGGLSDERFGKIKGFIRQPYVAFYWLFRCHVFADPRLEELLPIAADSPAKLVRDVAALVSELARGRKQLGLIEDWPAVLAQFRALDPLSNKAESEEEEEEQDKPALEIPDELAAEGAVIEWARAEGYSRENLLIYDELDAAALGLARRGDPKIVPVIAELHATDAWRASRLLAPWLDGDRADLVALGPQAREWLRDRESGALFRWVGGAAILARLHRTAAAESSDARLVADAIDPMLDSMFGREQGFSAALGSLETKKALPVMMESLITLGVPDSFVATLEGVVNADTHLVDDARGECAVALASVGRGLDSIVAGITTMIAKKHGHRIMSGQLLAVGMLGKGTPPERRAELVAAIESISRISDETKIGQRVALADLGRGGDVTTALREGLAGKRYSSDDTAKQRVALLRIVATRPDVSGELALPYVVTDELEVHRASVRTLAAKTIPAPELLLYDPYYVAQLASRGREAVHAALLEGRGVYRGNLALWIGDHPDVSSREPLIANARRLAAKPDMTDEGPEHYELRWTVRALLKIGGADAVLDELLHSPNRDVAEPVMRYDDDVGPGVARGMVHTYLNDEHWKQKTAKSWLLKHKADPAIAAALAEHGLSVADISRKQEEDE